MYPQLMFPQQIKSCYADHEFGIETHWRTGLVFSPGEIIDLAAGPLPTPSPPPPGAGFGIQASWSGYLLSSTASVTPGGNDKTGFELNIVPNPSGGSASVGFRLTEPDHVSVTIFDVQGRRIRTLFEGQLPAGEYAMPWNHQDSGGKAVRNGTYMVRVEALRSGSQSGKLAVR